MTTEEDNTTPPAMPNSDYFKPLELCDLIHKQPWAVFRKNALCFLTIALFASGLRFILALIFDVINGENYGADYGTQADVSGANYNYNSNQQMDVATLCMNIVDSIILYVVSCLADGATVQVVSEMYAGQTPRSPVVALGTVAYKAVPLVGSCLLISTGLTVLYLVLMPIAFTGRPGGILLMIVVWLTVAIYVSLITFAMYPAIVVENKGIIDSIKRSIHMTQGHTLKILAVLVVYSLYKSLFSILAVSITFSYEYTGSAAAFYCRAVLSFCINTFFIALRSILKSVIYFNIRITDEQLTQDKLSQEMGLLNEYKQMEEKDIEMEKQTTSAPDAGAEGGDKLAGKEVV